MKIQLVYLGKCSNRVNVHLPEPMEREKDVNVDTEFGDDIATITEKVTYLTITRNKIVEIDVTPTNMRIVKEHLLSGSNKLFRLRYEQHEKYLNSFDEKPKKRTPKKVEKPKIEVPKKEEE